MATPRSAGQAARERDSEPVSSAGRPGEGRVRGVVLEPAKARRPGLDETAKGRTADETEDEGPVALGREQVGHCHPVVVVRKGGDEGKGLVVVVQSWLLGARARACRAEDLARAAARPDPFGFFGPPARAADPGGPSQPVAVPHQLPLPLTPLPPMSFVEAYLPKRLNPEDVKPWNPFHNGWTSVREGDWKWFGVRPPLPPLPRCELGRPVARRWTGWTGAVSLGPERC